MASGRSILLCRATSCSQAPIEVVLLSLPGLRAQSQCRATIETLAVIKNPQAVAFVRQANIAAGPQQVNNGMSAAHAASRALENEFEPNRLLETQYGERLDTRNGERDRPC